jgi:hypothetical protein
MVLPHVRRRRRPSSALKASGHADCPRAPTGSPRARRRAAPAHRRRRERLATNLGFPSPRTEFAARRNPRADRARRRRAAREDPPVPHERIPERERTGFEGTKVRLHAESFADHHPLVETSAFVRRAEGVGNSCRRLSRVAFKLEQSRACPPWWRSCSHRHRGPRTSTRVVLER